MSVFNRISDIVNANINSLLEQAEDPEKIVRLISQEMQDTLVEVRSASARYIADRKQLRARMERSRLEATDWENKAELAISKGRDDLAKAALKERSRHQDEVNQFEAELQHIEAAIEKMKADTASLEEKLQYAKARQKALIVRGQTAKSRMKVQRQLHDVSVDEVFSRFESYERKLDELEGEVEAYDLGNRVDSTLGLATQIADLEKDEYLTAELDALKKRLAQEPKTIASSLSY